MSAALSYLVRHSILLPFVGSTLSAFLGAESPWVWLPEARVHPHPGYEEDS
jgi:hypothetical protein